MHSTFQKNSFYIYKSYNFHFILFITGKKIYRIKIEVDCPPEKLIRALETSHDITTWNKSLAKHEVIKEFPNGVKISYQVTPESGPGGVVSSRDFILVYKQCRKGKKYALKKYDQFTLNTSCFWGSTGSNIV